MNYLTVRDIVKINAKLITKTSKGEMIGVRDVVALERTVEQPKQIVFGEELYPSIYDKAAILSINLAKRHPFQNANKRTALVVMMTFFMMNGYKTTFSREETVSLLLTITTSSVEFDQLKANVAGYLKDSGKVIKQSSVTPAS
ncbi:type II toxin-antitoxin system death-on-curing family toxin [Enterococcus raffinosus]|uniref:Type II toxin-antitoxin system death-on-curing family toxin n=1 Tax=Enterococcus raffinosus TaxID=71452 RepID=A0AAW8SRS4_9ENTE|nr:MULTISPECIES: type II toxin-antitoxin system death-on-curing family toxin [Enterococcus]SBA36626.1 toxin-antitoxin system, toxin component, Fic family [Enterococcus faecium]MBS6430372.1 type II toxin-antitoxin system death-on-curing family toxin [Enterococcus raffinosus]MDK7989123.1 type II toxin-antitoxin system death-on-curing family toxin [Enterococcus raffinosus]MDT2536763.1 type II toxin-antitoxin system death-on-curing family toxin [Enterococcus raffinosus]MDT2570566.1 type II toxin-a